MAATRTGPAGEPGSYDKQSATARKFVVDFEERAVADLKPDSKLAVDVSASSGEIGNPYVIPVGTTSQRWRVFFDWTGNPPANNAPVVLHAILRDANHETLSETWVYS